MTTLKEIFVFFILPIMLAVGVCYCECRTDEKVWNEGICYYCGGNYEFSNASRGQKPDLLLLLL